jgi:hypothetical protein
VDWRSKKQETVALSSTEAEYMAASDGAAECVWIQRLLMELGRKDKPLSLMVDNQSAIAIAKNPVHFSKTKHIEVRWHFIREQVLKSKITLHFVLSREQAADFLTKAVVGESHSNSLQLAGLRG